MPGVITRKTRTPRGKLAATASSFTKVSKQQQAGKEISENTTPLTVRSANIEVVLPSRKRKVQDDTEHISKKARREPETQPIAPATPVSRKRKTVSFAEPEAAPSTPSRKLATPCSRKRSLESDETSQAEALLERLNLQSSPAPKRSKTTVHRRAPQNDFDLPRELVELLDLHVAFLKTLSMQYAHSGTTAPIDLRTLYPSVTRTWGKRHVTLDDIQRCIGVLAFAPAGKSSSDASPRAPYFLADYGRGKVCLEFHRDAAPGPLREPKLNMDFEASLRALWLARPEQQPATVFLGTLPRAAVKPCAALAKALLPGAKTQTTLDSFKKDIALRKQQEEEAKAAKKAAATLDPQQPTKTTNNNTNPPAPAAPLSLLDRIRLKESTPSSPTPDSLTPEQLQRRAALHRAADVAAIIGMLCKATSASQQQQRVSFTMAAVLTRLRDSARVPISREDGAACVRLLANEVAPQWLRVVIVGGRENVVCLGSGVQPSMGEVEERVRVLLR